MYWFVANIYYYDVIQDFSFLCDKNGQGKNNLHMVLNLIFMLPWVRAISPLWLLFLIFYLTTLSIPFCKLPFSIILILLREIRNRLASNSSLTSLQLNKVESSCLFHSHDFVRFNPLSPITCHSTLLRSSSISLHCMKWTDLILTWHSLHHLNYFIYPVALMKR